MSLCQLAMTDMLCFSLSKRLCMVAGPPLLAQELASSAWTDHYIRQLGARHAVMRCSACGQQ